MEHGTEKFHGEGIGMFGKLRWKKN